MRALRLLLCLVVGCGARTPLVDSDAAADVAAPILDRPAPVDLGGPTIDVGVDRPTADVPVLVDRPLPPPTDRPAFCGDGVVGLGEECDRGADNGPTDAFTLSQPGRPAVVVRPLVRSLSATAFYRYESASAHTGFEDVALANHILYVDGATGTLSLVFVAGRDGDLGLMPPQPDGNLQLNWSGVPTGASVVVSDDEGEFRSVGGGRFEGRWTFQDNTDGGAIQGLAWDQAWRITAQTLRTDGVTRVRFIGADGAPRALTLRDDVVITHRSGDLCREDCRRARCGDAQLDAGERCDDGNTVSGDGCSSDCQRFN
jgi:cysteine-rich repeat protein